MFDTSSVDYVPSSTDDYALRLLSDRIQLFCRAFMLDENIFTIQSDSLFLEYMMTNLKRLGGDGISEINDFNAQHYSLSTPTHAKSDSETRSSSYLMMDNNYSDLCWPRSTTSCHEPLMQYNRCQKHKVSMEECEHLRRGLASCPAIHNMYVSNRNTKNLFIIGKTNRWKEALFGYSIHDSSIMGRFYPPTWNKVAFCQVCHTHLGWLHFTLRHHCRNCGRSACGNCTRFAPLQRFGFYSPVRICILCVNNLQGCIEVL